MIFKDPNGTYTGGYVSIGETPTTHQNQRGVIQVEITSGTLNLEVRVDEAAPWFTAKTYSASTVEEVVLAPQMRVTATEAARAWLGETR